MVTPNSILYESNKNINLKRFEFKPLQTKHLNIMHISNLQLKKTHSNFAIIAKNKFGIALDLSIKKPLAYFKKNIPQKGVSTPLNDLLGGAQRPFRDAQRPFWYTAVNNGDSQ
jgi:hypothetical protein